MGTCLSRSAYDDPAAVGLQSRTKSVEQRSKSVPGGTKLTIVATSPTTGRNNHGLVPSPSEKTDATNPITPSSCGSSPPQNLKEVFSPASLSLVNQHHQRNLNSVGDEEECDEYNEIGIHQPSECSFEASINLGSHLVGETVIDSVIAEEESLGAPSDEEESHNEKLEASIIIPKRAVVEEKTIPEDERSVTSTASRKIKNNNKRGSFQRPGVAAGLSQSGVKVLSKRITTPESIINRPSLVAQPQGVEFDQLCIDTSKSSVNPQTVANFNRLKIQVELANRADKQRRHKEKVQYRFEDVKGYQNLWSEYETIQSQVAEKTNGECAVSPSKPEDGLDLKDSKSWYFDFRGLKGDSLEEDDDNCSQASLSLLSESNMEIQRRLFKEKRRKRRDGNTKKKRRDIPDDRSIGSINSTASKKSVVFLRGHLEEGGYGPVKQISIPGTVIVDSDEDTPKKINSRTGDDDYSRNGSLYDDASIISDLDTDNDYNVPRRRRRHHHNSGSVQDDQSVSTIGERSLEGYKLSQAEMELITDTLIASREKGAPRSIEVKMKTPKSSNNQRGTEHYGFDPSAPLSSQMDLTMPSVQIEDAKNGVVRWRNEEPERSKFGGAARRLEDLYGAEVKTKETGEKNQINNQGSDDNEIPNNDESCQIDATLDKQIESHDSTNKIPSSKEKCEPTLCRGSFSPKLRGDVHRKEYLADDTPPKSSVPLKQSYSSKFTERNPYGYGLSADDFLLLSISPHLERKSSFDEEEEEARIDSQEENRKIQEEREDNETANNEVSITGDDSQEAESLKINKNDLTESFSTKDGAVGNSMKTSDPEIEYMATDSFLLFSERSCVEFSDRDSDPSNEAPSNPQEDEQQPMTQADSDYVSEGIFDGISTSMQNESKRQCETCEKMNCNSCRVTIDHCDELADELSTTIGKMISDFREDSKIQ